MPYRGKHSRATVAGKHGAKPKGPASKTVALALSLALVAGVGIGGTLAWLHDNTGSITNTFTTANVPNTPVEEFEKNVKKSITVRNDGNIDAYVRVKLVTYRVDDDGNHIGGEATIPNFTLGADWKEGADGYYYYTKPVGFSEPDNVTGGLIAAGSSIDLKQYDDVDGGKQVIEVISESIQAKPTSTVVGAWNTGVSSVDANRTLSIKVAASDGQSDSGN